MALAVLVENVLVTVSRSRHEVRRGVERVIMVQIEGQHLLPTLHPSESLMRYSRRRRQAPKPHCTGALRLPAFHFGRSPHRKGPFSLSGDPNPLHVRQLPVPRALRTC